MVMRQRKGVRVSKSHGRTARRPGENSSKNRPTEKKTKLTGIALVVIVLLGLGLRASYLHEIVHNPDFSRPQIDAAYHDYWARGIATGNWTVPENVSHWEDPDIRSNPYLRPPGYPFFLAGIYTFTGGNYLATRLVQMALGLLNCLLAFIVGRRVFDRRTGLIFAFLMSCYWVFIYFEGELLAPVLLVTLGLSLVYALSFWPERFSFPRGLAGGLLLGLFAIVRANILVFVPALAGWCWWVARRRQDGRRLAPIGLGFTLGLVLTIAPITIRNWIVAKDFVPITSNVGISLYTGNHEGATGRYAIIPDLQELGAGYDWTCFDYPKIIRGVEQATGRKVSHSDVSDYFVDKALDFMRAHPGETLKLAAIKAALFWGPEEVGSNKAVEMEQSHSATLRYLPGFPWPLSLALLGLAQLVVMRRKHAGEQSGLPPVTDSQFAISVLIVLLILTYFLSYLPFFVVGRYRIPIIPFLFLFGAYGLARLSRLVAVARYRPAVGWVAALVVLFAVVRVPLVPRRPNPAQWHLLRASCYRLAGRPQLAIDECREAVQVDPESYEGHRRLADLLYRQGDLNGAIEHYSRAVALRPDYMQARFNLATALLAADRNSEAIVHVRWMANHYPNKPDVRYLLARTLRRLGQIPQAIAQYRKAIELKPDYFQAHNNLGNALMTQGKVEEAVRHYRRALQIRPDYALAQQNLQRALHTQTGKTP